MRDRKDKSPTGDIAGKDFAASFSNAVGSSVLSHRRYVLVVCFLFPFSVADHARCRIRCLEAYAHSCNLSVLCRRSMMPDATYIGTSEKKKKKEPIDTTTINHHAAFWADHTNAALTAVSERNQPVATCQFQNPDACPHRDRSRQAKKEANMAACQYGAVRHTHTHIS